MALSSKNPTKLRHVELDDDTSRLVADVPKRIHKLIRVKCAELEIDQRTLILNALAGQYEIK